MIYTESARSRSDGMNAKDAIDVLERVGSCDILHGNEELVLRALRLLAAAEGGELTPECDAAQVQVEFWVNGERREKCTTAIDAPTARRLERERNGLAARVRELEPDAERYRWLRVQRHADIAACWYLPVLPQDYPVDTPEQRDIAIDAARSK